MIAKWIGRRAADVVAFLRDKPFIPSDIDTTPSSVKFWNNPRYFGGVKPEGHIPDEECCDECDAGCWA